VYYNSVGTSDDSNPSFGNYDGAGHSYSAQALKVAGIGAASNQTLYYNGSTFAWPNSAAGTYNNDTAAGQTIPVTTIANADFCSLCTLRLTHFYGSPKH
jgi:hypothetical protein